MWQIQCAPEVIDGSCFQLNHSLSCGYVAFHIYIHATYALPIDHDVRISSRTSETVVMALLQHPQHINYSGIRMLVGRTDLLVGID